MKKLLKASKVLMILGMTQVIACGSSDKDVKEPFRCTQGVNWEGTAGIYPQAFHVSGKSLEQMIAHTWVEYCTPTQCGNAGYAAGYDPDGKFIVFSLDGTATIPQSIDAASCSGLSWVYTE